MNINEQIAILEAYKAGKRITWDSNTSPAGGQFDNGCIGFMNHEFDFQHNKYTVAPSTILVNGIEVPEPCRVMPRVGTEYYYPSFVLNSGVQEDLISDGGCSDRWIDERILSNGVMHLTESAARQHYEALIAPSRVKK